MVRYIEKKVFTENDLANKCNNTATDLNENVTTGLCFCFLRYPYRTEFVLHATRECVEVCVKLKPRYYLNKK